MSARGIVATAALLALGLAAGSSAQGLGDTAARERARRAAKAPAKKEPARVFTNDDLNAGRPPGDKSDNGSTTPASSVSDEHPRPSDEGAEAPAPAEDPLAQERPALDEISRAQAAIAEAESRVRSLADKLNPMSLSYIYGASGSNDANEELRVREELRQAESVLLSAKESLVIANRNLQQQRQGRPARSRE